MIETALVESALLTKSELNWLLGKDSNISRSYKYKIKRENKEKEN